MFENVISALDSAKLFSYGLKFLATNPFKDEDSVFADIRKPLSMAEITNITDVMGENFSATLENIATRCDSGELDITALADEINAAIEKTKGMLPEVKGENLLDAVLSTCDAADIKFYELARYGHYWNEVRLPDAHKKVFNAAVKTIAQNESLGIVIGEKPEDGYVAISYYDISDAVIVFYSMDLAKVFAEKNPVDPSDFMLYTCVSGSENLGYWQGV